MIELNNICKVPFEEISRHLIVEEGMCLNTYICPAGKRTIGVGHNLDAMPIEGIIGRENNNTITTEEALKILKFDVDKVITSLSTHLDFFKDLPVNHQFILIDLSFNIGINGLLKFKNTLAAFKIQNKEAIKNGLRNSKWARQVPNRAKRIIAMV